MKEGGNTPTFLPLLPHIPPQIPIKPMMQRQSLPISLCWPGTVAVYTGSAKTVTDGILYNANEKCNIPIVLYYMSWFFPHWMSALFMFLYMLWVNPFENDSMCCGKLWMLLDGWGNKTFVYSENVFFLQEITFKIFKIWSKNLKATVCVYQSDDTSGSVLGLFLLHGGFCIKFDD